MATKILKSAGERLTKANLSVPPKTYKQELRHAAALFIDKIDRAAAKGRWDTVTFKLWESEKNGAISGVCLALKKAEEAAAF